MLNHLRAPLLALLAVVLLAACSPGVVASLVPGGAGPLVTITTRGGECPEGTCGSTTVIERDGTVHITQPNEFKVGTVPADVLAALDAAIRVTDFAGLRSVPFVGECPVNFDGQEEIFEFAAPGGVQRIASCESAIDPDHPVFAAVSAAMGSVSEGG
ncbi:MAG: hypothetical protein WEC14_08705 [Chloroflexota bacterium]